MSRRFRPTDAYVDESIRGRRYVMGCVLVEARHLASLRPAVEALASGVAPRIHFNNDTDRQKRRVLDAIAEMPIQVFATVCTKDHSTTSSRLVGFASLRSFDRSRAGEWRSWCSRVVKMIGTTNE